MNAPPYSGASVLQSSYRMGGRLPQSLDQFTGAAGGADGFVGSDGWTADAPRDLAYVQQPTRMVTQDIMDAAVLRAMDGPSVTLDADLATR